MRQKRQARRNRRRATGGSPTFRSAAFAFATTFAAALTALLQSGEAVRRPMPPIATVPVSGAPFAGCRQHFPGGEPPVPAVPDAVPLCFDTFAVLYSGTRKTPVYAVERLTAASVAAAGDIPRSDQFHEEARLPVRARATLEDYRGSGYDRGHMAPAGDMPTAAAEAQSFSLANMVPQHPQLNQRAWSQVEQATRKFVRRTGGEMYVFTGPSFGRVPPTVGAGRVWVPKAIWKVVHAPRYGRTWAYWMSNDARPHSLQPIGYGAYLARGGPDVLPAAGHRAGG